MFLEHEKRPVWADEFLENDEAAAIVARGGGSWRLEAAWGKKWHAAARNVTKWHGMAQSVIATKRL